MKITVVGAGWGFRYFRIRPPEDYFWTISKLGHDLLVIWENELENEGKVLDKIGSSARVGI